ncbi:MAG TPA: M20/M25/M40 family metallo-hydrolase [Terriglobales bacterium]|jgi:carboxypeptidase Q|nr:M20/M25/M40 family metallo-hydrolase [Terriglobales bacterium]
MSLLLPRKRSISFPFLLATIAFIAAQLIAQAPSSTPTTTRTDDEKRAYRTAMEQADQKIVDEVKAHSELMKNLEYLTTEIGPRLTGSPQMNRASDWTLQRFKDYGIDAHLETTEIPHAWTRGQDTAEITAPFTRPIEIRSAGWSKATDGAVTGNVIFLNLANSSDVEKQKSKLKGAIIMTRPPAELSPENEIPNNAYDAVIPPRRGVPNAGARARFRERQQMMQAAADAGAAVVLIDSGKRDSLFNMTAFSRYQPSRLPTAFLAHEDYSLIYRLLQRGPVSMKINLTGTFSPNPAKTSITVAEIKGSEHPEERVIVGGHLDSWDLGQGAIDNGTGAMATLEAARTLSALGWKPKRTITFILFTGEEEGGTGAELFVKNHEAEIPKIDAALILDLGTAKVFTIVLENQYETVPLMQEIYQPLQELFGLDALDTRYYGSSDHVEFLNKGVPAYFGLQKPDHYGQAHHSQADTFDKVIPDEINQGAGLLAAWAWNVSEMPQALPHHAPREEQGAE